MYAQPLPDNTDRGKWAASLLMVNLCLFAIMTIRDIFKLFAEDVYYSYYSITQITEGILDLCGSLLIIVTAVFFIMWFRRAYNNLHIAGARFLPYKEGWAAGAWFVPIVNWFYPYRIMNAIWQETPAAVRKVGENYERNEEGNIGGWWALWLIGNIVSNIQSQIVLRGGASLDSTGIVVLDLISDACMLGAAWMGMRIVKRIGEMELDLQRRYNEWLAFQTQQHAQQFGQQQSFSPPPPAGPPQY